MERLEWKILEITEEATRAAGGQNVALQGKSEKNFQGLGPFWAKGERTILGDYPKIM